MRAIIRRAAARKRLHERRRPQPELVRSIVIPKRGQPRLNGQPVPWLISEDGLQFQMPGQFEVGHVTLEMPFVRGEISVFEYGGRGA